MSHYLRWSIAALLCLLGSTALPLTVTISILAKENCAYANGKLRAQATGGVPPYTYAWSNGSTQQVNTQLASGTYSVIVTDSQGEQGSASQFLPSGPFTSDDAGLSMDFQGPPYCMDMNPQGPLFNFDQPVWSLFPGVPPFTFNGQEGTAWNCNDALAGYLVSLPGAQEGSTVDVAFMDANGCPGTLTVEVGYEVQWPSLTTTNIRPSCAGANNGSFSMVVGAEGHGASIFLQVTGPTGEVVLGANGTYIVGPAQVNATLDDLAAGTYTISLSLTEEACSPLAGQCTSTTEVVVPEDEVCACLNNEMYPPQPYSIIGNGQLEQVSPCVFLNEYTAFTNVQAGGIYVFGVSDSGFMTVRQGTAAGVVLATGMDQVQIIAPNNAPLFVHYNVDEFCAGAKECAATTVTRILDCVLPEANFLPYADCAAALYYVTVEVTNLGDASGVDIVIPDFGIVHANVGPGSYDVGPFASINDMAVSVVNTQDANCRLIAPPLTLMQPCPVLVDCGAAALQETFCYGNAEERSWTYAAEGGSTLRLHFQRGTIENASYDHLTIHDGVDATGPVLFDHVQTTTQNLGPTGSALNNSIQNYYTIDVLALSGSIFMTLSTDGSVSCGSTAIYDPWEWTVTCLDCSPPQGNASVVDIDCEQGRFAIEVQVASTGDQPTSDLRYVVDGGTPVIITGLGIGTTMIGPFDLASAVELFLQDPTGSTCTTELGTIVADDNCPTAVVCGDGPVNETYCYQSNEYREWVYTAASPGLLELRFLRGRIESATWDSLRIHDGTDATGDLLFEHVNASSSNLGPSGSGILGPNLPYYGVNVQSSTGSLYMVLRTDNSGACSSNSDYDPWEWEVRCGNATLTGRAFMDDQADCAWNPGEPPVGQTILEILPGPIYATTSTNGTYFLSLADGDYSVEQVDPYLVDRCSLGPQNFSVTGQVPVIVDFPDTATTGLDLDVQLTSGPARVGSTHLQALVVRNLSGSPSGPITLTLEKPPVLVFQGAEPAPSTASGQTISWQLAPLGPFQQHPVQLQFTVPSDVNLIGAGMITTVAVSNTLPEIQMANNALVHPRIITATSEPNVKVATTSSGTSDSTYFLDLDDWIEYTIQFQNTGTTMSYQVVVTDTLPGTLDPTTIQMGAASHPFTWSLSGPGILRITFSNIQLPSSAANEDMNVGFVSFRIAPRQPLSIGTEISNTAHIAFDIAPPVLTDPCILVVETSTRVHSVEPDLLRIWPNPAHDQVRIRMDRPIALITLHGMDGRVIQRTHPRGPEAVINTEGYASGCYLLSVTTDLGRVTHSTLTIQH